MVTRHAPRETPESENSRFRDRLSVAARQIGRPLSDAEAAAMASHYRLLRRWGARMNLTGLKDEEAILSRHFLEPIAASDLLSGEGRLLDLGSGNGFPAVPLKVLHPGLALVLVEASEKKSAFLWAVLRELGLKEARVETRRVERAKDLDDLLPCRYLTFRALRGRDLLEGAGDQLLEPGGRALLFVSVEEAEELRQRPVRGLRWVETRPLPSGRRSALAVFEPGARSFP